MPCPRPEAQALNPLPADGDRPRGRPLYVVHKGLPFQLGQYTSHDRQPHLLACLFLMGRPEVALEPACHPLAHNRK